MCTAIYDWKYRPMLGRTLDLEYTNEEAVLRVDRGREMRYLFEPTEQTKAAMIGTAYPREGFPLFYDAVNEYGVAAAALHFPRSARYRTDRTKRHAVASFEVIPWVLGRCRTAAEAAELLRETSITVDQAAPELPASPLHWMIADQRECYAVEPLEEGTVVTPNPYGVLTNEPPFSHHVSHLSQFSSLSPHTKESSLYPHLPRLSNGTGAVGLPGDWSSPSRFVRAAFVRACTLCDETKNKKSDELPQEINRFFHIMDTVALPLGVAYTEDGKPISTVYTACADLAEPAYYLRRYHDCAIRKFSLTD